MKINALITGTTGMVGKGVLIECLDHPEVESVVVINRKALGLSHPKLTEIIHSDFYDLISIKHQLSDVNACFFCLGTSSIGKSEDEYNKITFNLTISFAKTLIEVNPNMTFNYVSGTGCDSSEKGNTMWARVKGKTENAILTMGFKQAYMFRPGIILPEKGVKSATGWYNAAYVVLRPLFPLLKQMKSITTSVKIGDAMINSVISGYKKQHLENVDINILAN
ncbi:MAG: epimerase [Flavobacteriales bacterium]|nr:epimerase [Flavobacteriales bacterium]